MKRGETELTLEQLQLAWRHLHRPGWPATLEATLQDPRRNGCVRGLARQLSRVPFNAASRGPAHSLPSMPAPPTQTEPLSQRKVAARLHGPDKLGFWPTRMPNAFDAKRAAANDLKD